MVALRVMFSSFDILTARTAMSIAVLFEQATGYAQSRWCTFDSRFRRWWSWFAVEVVFSFESVAPSLVKLDVGVGI